MIQNVQTKPIQIFSKILGVLLLKKKHPLVIAIDGPAGSGKGTVAQQLATKLNYLALGKYRKPIIENKVTRVIIYAISIVILSIATLGFFLSK